jgi:hypothetical protein
LICLGGTGGFACLSLEQVQIIDLEFLSVVALTDDLPANGLLRGQVGTIIEKLAPGIY